MSHKYSQRRSQNFSPGVVQSGKSQISQTVHLPGQYDAFSRFIFYCTKIKRFFYGFHKGIIAGFSYQTSHLNHLFGSTIKKKLGLGMGCPLPALAPSFLATTLYSFGAISHPIIFSGPYV